LGAIAVAAKKSTPPPRPETAMPVVSINKADRLPTIISRNDTQPDTEKKVEIASADQNEPVPSPTASKESAPARDPDIAPRHRHDRHHVKAGTESRRSSARQKAPAADPPPAQVSELKECRSDGLYPLMRQLNLSPQCN
jgi:hypothetical protein